MPSVGSDLMFITPSMLISGTRACNSTGKFSKMFTESYHLETALQIYALRHRVHKPQTDQPCLVTFHAGPCTQVFFNEELKFLGARMSHEKTHLPNWTGLLGWSTKYHDGTSSSQFGPMDSERREWLEKALKAAFDGVEDPFKLMHKAVKEITDGRASAGLDLLDYTSDFPDCAEELDKVGALAVVLNLVKESDEHIVRRALEVLNMYLPNNPRVQLAAQLKYNALEVLKSAISRFSGNDEVIHSSLSAIGSLIRNVESLEKGFVRDKNIEFLVQIALESNIEHTVQKCVGILCFLYEKHELQSHIRELEKLAQSVYSRRGTVFGHESIQFWEIAARMSNIRGLSPTCLGLLKQRLEWIMARPKAERDDLSEEVRILSCSF